MITTQITFVCDGVSNEKACKHSFVQTGAKVTRRSTKVAAKKAGWQWKGRLFQFCPEHAFVKVEKAKAVKAVKKVVKTAPKKALPVRKATVKSIRPARKDVKAGTELAKAMGLTVNFKGSNKSAAVRK